MKLKGMASKDVWKEEQELQEILWTVVDILDCSFWFTSGFIMHNRTDNNCSNNHRNNCGPMSSIIFIIISSSDHSTAVKYGCQYFHNCPELSGSQHIPFGIC